MSRRPAAHVRGIGTLHLAARQLITDRLAVATVAVIVLVCSLLASALPRAMDRLLTDGLRHAVNTSTPSQRDLVMRGAFLPPLQEGQDPFAPTRTMLDEIHSGLPGKVRRQVGPGQYAVSYTEMGAGEIVPKPAERKGVMNWGITTQSGFADHVSFVDGRAPEKSTTSPLPGVSADTYPIGAYGAGDPTRAQLTIVEVAVSSRTAEVAGVGVGSRVKLGNNLEMVVVGVYEATDAEDPYWGWSQGVLRPSIVVSPALGDIYKPVVVAAESTWPAVEQQIAYTISPQLLLRFPVSGDGLQGRDTADLLALVRQATSTPHTAPERTLPGTSFWTMLDEFRLGTTLDRVLVGELHAQAASTAVVSVVVAGVLGVALAVLALAARLVVERRRRHLALAVARGASPRQIAVVMAAEGLLLGVPAALIGAVLAGVLVDGAPGLWGIVLPLLLGLAPAVLLPMLARPGGLRAVRRDVTSRRGRRFRLAAELLVAALAVAGLVLLRRRGLDSGSFDVVGGLVTLGRDAEVPDVGVDPLLALTPVLLALALALLLARVYPRPVAALAALAARRRGAVPFLGAARAGRDATAGVLPLVVLLLALATSVFGSVVASTSDRGADDASWQLLGAPARLTGIGFTDDQLAAGRKVEGVDSVAGMATSSGEVNTERRRMDVTVAGVDAIAMTRVQRGVPGAVPLDDLVDNESAGSGTSASNHVPVLVSTGVADVGQQIRLTVERVAVDAVVVETADRIPGLLTSGAFVVADRGVLANAQADVPVPVAALVRLTPGADGGSVGRSLRTALDTAAPMVEQRDVVTRVRSQPLVAGTLEAFPAASVVTAALSALAVVLTLVVSAPDRTQLLSRLRTLGLSGRQARWLVVWEVAPLAATALAAGAVVGVLVPWWVLPAVDLRAFTGGAAQPLLTVDWVRVLLILGGFVLVTAVSLAIAVAANRRLRLGTVLRVGD
ncbi:MAG TPA: FtsX-like permease family protein [Actinomycetales bacterium]|nr:FtsX-like permease family protein [Actinomycetales bacterium]